MQSIWHNAIRTEVNKVVSKVVNKVVVSNAIRTIFDKEHPDTRQLGIFLQK